MTLGCRNYEQMMEIVSLRKDEVKHLSSYKHNPMVADAISFKKSLTSRIDDFYDLSRDTSEGLNFYIKEEDSSKKGVYPIELVEVLNSSLFDERSLELSKLEYGFVRKECEKLNEPLFEALLKNITPGRLWQIFSNRIAWAMENRCNAGDISELMRLYRSAESTEELIRRYGNQIR